MLKPLLFEHPEAPGCWTTEDEYIARWHRINAGEVPVVMLIEDDATLPRAELAQSTDRIDWSETELAVFGRGLPPPRTAKCPACTAYTSNATATGSPWKVIPRGKGCPQGCSACLGKAIRVLNSSDLAAGHRTRVESVQQNS